MGFPSSALAVSGGTVTPAAGPAGTNVVVTGTCDIALSNTARIIVSTPAVQTASDATLVAGAFSIPFTVPPTTPAGTYPIAVDCGFVVLNLFTPLEATTRAFTVPGAAVFVPPTPTTTPPDTGGFADLTGFDLGPAVPVTGVPRFTG